MLITAFRNLKVRIIPSGGDHAFLSANGRLVKRFNVIMMFPCKNLLQGLNNCFYGRCTYDGIHFLNFRLDFFLITLCQTSCHNQCFQPAALFQLCHLKNRVNALLLGIIDKTAGIDDNSIRMCLIIGKTISLFSQHAEHDL